MEHPKPGADPYAVNACLPRSAANLSDVVGRLSPETNPLWKRRDVTGDGKAETFCNQFLHAALELLECPLPGGLLAAQQIEWLDRHGKANGWRSADEISHETGDPPRKIAIDAANTGRPVVVGWTNPNPKAPSHVALGVPTPFGEEFQIAQAGAENFNAGTLRRGFGNLPVRFWVHD